MKLSATQEGVLRSLLQGNAVAASTLRKDIAATLIEEGLLTVRANGSRRAYQAIDTEALGLFLEARYEELRTADFTSRASQARDTGNSKLSKVRSCPGFPVNSYEPLACRLRGRELVVSPPEGAFLFIDDWLSFSIPVDVVVVGIENMENFRMIRRQRTLFRTALGGARLLFVSRYPQSTDLRRWLTAIPNRYVHFGDFDLAGINIFITEFYNHFGHRASFLVPPDIERRLAAGSQTRYNEQYARFHALQSSQPCLQSLIDLINKYRRGYDQEGYIGKIED